MCSFTLALIRENITSAKSTSWLTILDTPADQGERSQWWCCFEPTPLLTDRRCGRPHCPNHWGQGYSRR